MKQIVHIFRKDSRRFWPEILVSLAVMAMFAVIVPNEWRLSAGLSPGTQTSTTLIGIVTLLLPLSWWLLIGRVIHAESLVGDNQHWLTRPYEWYNLLAAKLLFCVAYVCVPLLCAQCALLGMAGFHPVGYTTGLLYSLNDTACILLLPMIVVAVVTSTFARMTLTTLGIMLSMIGILLFAEWRGPDNGASIPYADGNSGWLGLACFVVTCAATLIVQYATRRVWIARLLPLTFVVALAVLEFAFPTHRDVDHAYPRAAASAAPPLLFVLATDAEHPSGANDTERAGEIQLNIPVDATGIAEGEMVEPDDVQVTIDGPGELHSVLPWQSMYSNKFMPGRRHTQAYFKMSRALFERIKGSTVHLQMTFALTTFTAGHRMQRTIPLIDAPVPELGYCSVTSTRGWSMLSCRNPLRQPPLTYATVPLTDGLCAEDETGSGSSLGAAWLGGVHRETAEAGISPVKLVQPTFDLQDAVPGDFQRQRRLHACPGRPITFTEYNLSGRARTELVIPQFVVPAEATSQDRGVGAIAGFSVF